MGRFEGMERENVSISVVQFIDRELEKERDLVDAKFIAAEKATELVKRETERRMEILNHAREEMQEDKARFLTKEIYDLHIHEFHKWRDTVNAQLNNQAGRTATWLIVMGIGTVLVNVIMHYWK
jgi:CHASE3 domain sensor protein